MNALTGLGTQISLKFEFSARDVVRWIQTMRKRYNQFALSLQGTTNDKLRSARDLLLPRLMSEEMAV